MDTSAIQAAAAATSATYRSFADATRSVLDLLERHMPSAGLYPLAAIGLTGTTMNGRPKYSAAGRASG